jgi:hypothetical protein
LQCRQRGRQVRAGENANAIVWAATGGRRAQARAIMRATSNEGEDDGRGPSRESMARPVGAVIRVIVQAGVIWLIRFAEDEPHPTVRASEEPRALSEQLL